VGTKKYLEKNVLEAAEDRIRLIFDNFENIYVSVSSGKDSTVLYTLTLAEAVRRGRKIKVFFLDQEVEYAGTVVTMRKIMDHPNVIPMWYQVPIYMTNATSFQQDMFYAWGPEEEWMRDKESIAFKEIVGKYPQRFYKFFEWFEAQQPPGSAFFVGLRGDESLNRHRAVSNNPGWGLIRWSTKIKNNSYKFYPIYDWGLGDIWKYIYENNLFYNPIYDKMYSNNHSFYNTMRVSNLIHEKSFYCLTDLQVLEPETYEKIVKRLKGTHCAAMYANDSFIYSTDKLPEKFTTWKEYRDYLLETTPYGRKDRFVRRFDKQSQDEYIFRQQCKQLLISDWEGNLPVVKEPDKEDKFARWRNIL
jgi:predicted phosphoadenosine phosphosulfate sulfurtransferase